MTLLSGVIYFPFFIAVRSTVKRGEKWNIFINIEPWCDSLKLMERNENANKCIVQELWGDCMIKQVYFPRGKLALT